MRARRNGFQRRLAIGLVVWVVAIAGCTGKNGQPGHFEGEAQVSSAAIEPFLGRLEGVEPGIESAPDLERVAEWLAGAEIVGLGESDHGTHDLHRLGHRVFRHLAETAGYGVFAWEISQVHARKLDEYVQGERDDLDAVMGERWWVSSSFYDVALRDLLIWMRRHNDTAAKPLHFAGFDFKQPSFAMNEVVERLRRLDGEAAEHAKSLFERVKSIGGYGVFPNVYGFSGSVEIPLPEGPEPRTATVGIAIRGEGVSHGWAGLTVESVVSSPSSPKRHFVKPEDLGASWAPINLEYTPHAEATAIRVTVFHRGNGTVWFDDLAVDLGNRYMDLAESLPSLEVRPLTFPDLQVMNYGAHVDESVFLSGGSSLRVECDPAVDEALEAARAADELVRNQLERNAGRLSEEEATWLQQLSRLIVQSCEWQTLVETNRDVFLAENVTWLHEKGFSESPLLALGHTSHTERVHARMGTFLAEQHDDRYMTVSMQALRGENVYFDTPSTSLETFTISPEGLDALTRLVSEKLSGSALFGTAAALGSASARSFLEGQGALSPRSPDVLIVVDSVRPATLIPEYDPR